MCNDIAIQIDRLSKLYNTYKHPRDRVLDALGLGWFVKNRCEQFWALRDVSLRIKKGSKIALIGRNGAGKSTLLKIIAGSLKPTSGSVTVNGKVSALMELGTGFHPEFTGRENIFASLAYSGIVGKEAKEKFEEIVEFSELEEFIDSPVKTYSAGMYARLAFATSTAVVPEILIIDEILGAGDAYFINKSIDRMKRLTEGGTTVLFVSHDITSVQKMCTDAIWIDKGRIVMEGDILDVSAEYLASIRKQEERRIKARNIRLKHNNFKTLEEGIAGKIIYFHLITEHGSPKDKHPISEIRLKMHDETIHSLRVGDVGDANSNHDMFLIADKETMNWSDPMEEQGRRFRRFENVGGEYQHALFAWRTEHPDEIATCNLEIDYQDISTEVVKVEVFDGEAYKWIGDLEAKNDHRWKTASFQLSECFQSTMDREEGTQQQLDYQELQRQRENNSRIYGSGEVILTSVEFLNESSEVSYIFQNLGYMKLRIHYFAEQMVKHPVFVAAFYLLDGTCAMQLISNKDGFEVPEINGEGYVEIYLNPLLLGKGTYLVSVAIFKELNLLDNVEPPAYDLHDKMYEIKVEQPFGINVEVGVLNHPVRWGWRSKGG